LAKIGFLALAAKWFSDSRKVVLRLDTDLARDLESRIRSIEGSLAASCELISAGIVTTEQSALSAAAKFREANVDALIACCVVWSEDQPALEVLETLQDVPLLLWCWTPGASLPKTLSAHGLMNWTGPVGAQQIAGALRRSGRKFSFVMGSNSEKETIQEIRDFIEAAKVRRFLKHARIGLIPHRFHVMTNTWVDEFDLARRFGVDIIYVSANELFSSVKAVKEAELQRHLDGLRDMRISPEVKSEGIKQAAKVSLGLAKIVENLHLDAVSIADYDDELHAIMKCRPCLYSPSIFERGVVVGMEGDLLGILGQLILSRLSGGQPTMFTEILTYDNLRRQILVGHPGMHDIRLAKSRSAVRLTPDYEWLQEPAGVWMEFSVRPGPVTLLSIASTQVGFHFVITKGEALRARNRLEGYPHALVKLDIPLRSFFRTTTKIGTTQHWALVSGDLSGRTCELANMLGVECTVLNKTQDDWDT